jgi:hypothetical protein
MLQLLSIITELLSLYLEHALNMFDSNLKNFPLANRKGSLKYKYFKLNAIIFSI